MFMKHILRLSKAVQNIWCYFSEKIMFIGVTQNSNGRWVVEVRTEEGLRQEAGRDGLVEERMPGHAKETTWQVS